nr:hypothetical protein GCM10025699_46010 [Microbacterium flavescens]
MVELADEAGVTLPVTGGSADLDRWFVESATAGSLTDYIATFDVTVAVMQTESALQRVAREFVLDLAADGVVHAEVRWAPEQHLRGGLSLDQAVEAVQAGIDEAVSALADDDHELSVGQILSAMRHADRSLEIATLAVRHREAGVLGFDIAGAEEGTRPATTAPPSTSWPASSSPSPCTPARPTGSTASAGRCSTAGRSGSVTASASPRTSV